MPLEYFHGGLLLLTKKNHGEFSSQVLEAFKVIKGLLLCSKKSKYYGP